MTTSQHKTGSERSAEIQQKYRTKERRRRFMFIGAISVVVAVLIAMAAVGIRNLSQDSDAAPRVGLESASGRGAVSAPPWPLPTDAPARVAAAGLNLGRMGTAEHYHAHLDILVDGQPVAVPVNIGIDLSNGSMSALHTHSGDGIIHVEAATKGQPFTLGQLFTQWNVRLSGDQMGSLTAVDGKSLTAYVNGEKITSNPAMIRLAERQQISIVFGPTNAKVKVPDTFDFGNDL